MSRTPPDVHPPEGTLEHSCGPVYPMEEEVVHADAERLAQAVKAVVMLCFPTYPGAAKASSLRRRIDTAFIRFAALAYQMNASGMDVRSQCEYARILGVSKQKLSNSMQLWDRLLAGERCAADHRPPGADL